LDVTAGLFGGSTRLVLAATETCFGVALPVATGPFTCEHTSVAISIAGITKSACCFVRYDIVPEDTLKVHSSWFIAGASDSFEPLEPFEPF
jgi:hypothetical protein